MIEKVGNRRIECKSCADGYSICVDGNQVWWVDYCKKLSEKEAETAFSAIVSAMESIHKLSNETGANQ